MAKLNRQNLRRLIQLEMKSLMDEDALLAPPNIGEPHYMDYHDSDYDDDYDDYDDEIPTSNMTIYEGSDCGCHSGCSDCGSNSNPYEDQRVEDFGIMSMDDDHDHKHRHSSYMARPQLYKIAKYASALLDMVDENEELEDWQESKIAQISQMIGSVYHSLDYDEEYDDHDDLNVHDLIGMIRTGNI